MSRVKIYIEELKSKMENTEEEIRTKAKELYSFELEKGEFYRSIIKQKEKVYYVLSQIKDLLEKNNEKSQTSEIEECLSQESSKECLNDYLK